MRTLICALACCLAPVAWADVPARLSDVFDAWVAGAEAKNAVILAQKDGHTMLHVAQGWNKDAPVALASVSKSITALCVAQLITEGALDADTTSLEVLKYGVDGLTVAQLLTHSGGLKPDQTQSFMYLWLDADTSMAELASQRALGRALPDKRFARYLYNNENYAVLGEMIAAVTGQTYEEACRARVMVPAGVQGALTTGRTASTLPWGGWDMPVTDYARILNWGFGPEGIVGRNPRAWPQHALGGPVSYGMGMFQGPSGAGRSYWHFGSWCFPWRYNTGAYAVRWHNGWSVVMAFDSCLDRKEMGGLRDALAQAVFE